MSLFEPEIVPHNNWKMTEHIIKNNWERLEAIDRKSAKKGTLLYRYITHGFADGYAVYQITRVNKKSVRIRVCGGLGDDWVLPAWGHEATIPIEYAQKEMRRRDNPLFGKDIGKMFK